MGCSHLLALAGTNVLNLFACLNNNVLNMAISRLFLNGLIKSINA